MQLTKAKSKTFLTSITKEEKYLENMKREVDIIHVPHIQQNL